MRRKPSLITLIALSIVGILFSGYLSYQNYFSDGCSETLFSCGGDDAVLIFGQPTCIYGLGMYMVVLILSVLALVRDSKRPLQKAIFVLGLIGVLFAGSLSVYELFVQDKELASLPACVYGFFIYLAIFIVAWLGLSKKNLALAEHTETELTIKNNK